MLKLALVKSGQQRQVHEGDESGIDWRTETIDFSEGLLLELVLTEKEIRRAMQDELAGSGCVWGPRGRRYLSKTLRIARVLGLFVRLYSFRMTWSIKQRAHKSPP